MRACWAPSCVADRGRCGDRSPPLRHTPMPPWRLWRAATAWLVGSLPGQEPGVDGLQEDLYPTHVLRRLVEEIRQRAEQLPEQRVRAALRREIEGGPAHRDRAPAPVEMGGSKVQDELHTDAGTSPLSSSSTIAVTVSWITWIPAVPASVPVATRWPDSVSANRVIVRTPCN